MADHTPWVLKPLDTKELLDIRQRLEDGDIPGGEKYAVIQRLIESHLLLAKQRDKHLDQAYSYAGALDAIATVLKNEGLI